MSRLLLVGFHSTIPESGKWRGAVKIVSGSDKRNYDVVFLFPYTEPSNQKLMPVAVEFACSSGSLKRYSRISGF